MFFDLMKFKTAMPEPDEVLPNRAHKIIPNEVHIVLNSSMLGPWPKNETVLLGLGCFWGAERLFWQLEGVTSTQVGYAGGTTENPTYQDVCSGKTGHNEVVRVVWDATQISFDKLLNIFFEAHDPTQGFRQGNDRGTQYRSGIYPTTKAQEQLALKIKNVYEKELYKKNMGPVTTEIIPNMPFYFAEDEHQQYLAKNPDGYCGLAGTGVACPILEETTSS